MSDGEEGYGEGNGALSTVGAFQGGASWGRHGAEAGGMRKPATLPALGRAEAGVLEAGACSVCLTMARRPV